MLRYGRDGHPGCRRRHHTGNTFRLSWGLAPMNILEALDDPNLLGASIRDPKSWKPWRAFLAAAFGLPMDDAAAELFRQCTGRAELPTAAFQFIWLVIGRRGGKIVHYGGDCGFPGLLQGLASIPIAGRAGCGPSRSGRSRTGEDPTPIHLRHSLAPLLANLVENRQPTRLS